jgi:phage shock protein A
MVAKAMEKRVPDLEEMVDDIPRLINIRFTHVRVQLDALDARIGIVETKVDRLETRIASLEAKIDALPRILAEMLDERERRRQ